jgi:hypothetical protein
LDDLKRLLKRYHGLLENSAYRKESILNNRKFIEDAADYKINMKLIATKYHGIN